MNEGILGEKGNIRPVEMVSPSRLHSFQRCSLKEVWDSCGNDELLPRSPKSELGFIAHKIIEEAGMGHFSGTERMAIEERWDTLVENSEKRMKRNWLVRHFVPLKDSESSFEVRRLQAVERAVELNDGYREESIVPKVTGKIQEYGFEIPVDSHDGFVRGRIDVVLSSESGPILRDYKSGYILEKNGDAGVVKRDYVVQLHMYAALYYRKTGRWPTRLQLAPITGPPIEIEFTPTECESLLEGAVTYVRKINSTITEHQGSSQALEQKLANPSVEICRFCGYRPWCSMYRATVDGSDAPQEWPNDIWGIVNEIRTLGNGKVLLRFESGTRVRGLSGEQERHPALIHLTSGARAGVYCARRTRSKQSFIEGSFTTIYKE